MHHKATGICLDSSYEPLVSGRSPHQPFQGSVCVLGNSQDSSYGAGGSDMVVDALLRHRLADDRYYNGETLDDNLRTDQMELDETDGAGSVRDSLTGRSEFI